MTNLTSTQPKVVLKQTAEYREGYANSIQVQMSVWDFRLSFGTAHQDRADEITINNFQSVYLSPQQAKTLWNMLGQNVLQYEQTFGHIALEPKAALPTGPVH
jgi:flagellar protein FlaG